MDFNKLTRQELCEFLRMYGQEPINSQETKQAEKLFETLKQSEASTYPSSVLDLCIATKYLQNCGQSEHKYSETDVQNNKIAFAKSLGLNSEHELFMERSLRILRILGSLKPDLLWGWEVSENESPIPIKYPVNKAYSLDQIVKRRNLIKQKMVQSGANEDFSNFQEEHLRYAYELYNEHFFNNSLPKFIKLEVSNRMTSVAGKCGPCPNFTKESCECKQRIKISIPVFRSVNLAQGEKTESGGVESDTKLGCMQLVLEHEMIHLAIRDKFGPERKNLDKTIYSSHGSLFKNLVKSYFGQTRSTHSIGKITSVQEPVTKGELKMFDGVSCKDKNGVKKGIVLEINRVNVTVAFSSSHQNIFNTRYNFLCKLQPDDEDIEIVNTIRDDFKKKLALYNQLQVGDSVRVAHRGDSDVVGAVTDLKPRSKGVSVESARGGYIYKYYLLISKESSNPSCSVRPKNTSSNVSKDSLNVGEYVVSSSGTKGIVVKKNPKNAVVYTLKHKFYDFRYGTFKHVPEKDNDFPNLEKLKEKYQKQRALFGTLQIGDKIQYASEPYSINQTPTVLTGEVTKILPGSNQIKVRKGTWLFICELIVP